MLKIYLTGLVILVAAILLNGIVARLGIMGWYEFLTKMTENGTSVFRETGPLDLIWLFLLYPTLLGGSAWIAEKIHQLIFGS
jgi:hypothetical protein